MYGNISFSLMNRGETFQRVMDINFVGEKDRFIVVYLDDIKASSQLDEEHRKHLKQTFLKCSKFGLSLNPKNTYFDGRRQVCWEYCESKKYFALIQIEWRQSKKSISP